MLDAAPMLPASLNRIRQARHAAAQRASEPIVEPMEPVKWGYSDEEEEEDDDDDGRRGGVAELRRRERAEEEERKEAVARVRQKQGLGLGIGRVRTTDHARTGAGGSAAADGTLRIVPAAVAAPPHIARCSSAARRAPCSAAPHARPPGWTSIQGGIPLAGGPATASVTAAGKSARAIWPDDPEAGTRLSPAADR